MSQAGIVSWSGGATGAITFITDSGSATPSGGNLNVLGGTGISTTGSGNTITINASLEPNSFIQDFDDFISNNGVGQGKFGWSTANGASLDTRAANPGIVVFADQTSYVSLNEGISTLGGFILGGGSLQINWVMDLVALANVTDNYTTYIGLTNDVLDFTGSPPDEGIYFQYNYNVNSGNWQVVSNAAATTTVNTATSAATGFHNYGILINAAASSVSFTINGVAVGTPIITNIPLTQIVPTVYTLKSAGTLPFQEVDLFYYTQTLTVSR